MFLRSEKKFPKKGSLEQIDSGTESATSQAKANTCRNHQVAETEEAA
jgi:hypothetical protein